MPTTCLHHFCCVIGVVLSLVTALLMANGWAWINIGPVTPIVRTQPDEKYYLVKEVILTASSAYNPKEVFDHNMNDRMNLMFSPTNEKNHYVAESIWYDPDGAEFRTIRVAYDKKYEQQEGIERPKGGTRRIHTIPTRDLYNHKPGIWKVALKLDGELARRLSFTVR